MTGGDPEQSQGRTFGAPTALLPVAQCVNADAERLSELHLRQIDEAPKRDDIFAASDASVEDSLALLPRNSAGEVPVRQLTNVIFVTS
jgi:hypothetical protein